MRKEINITSEEEANEILAIGLYPMKWRQAKEYIKKHHGYGDTYWMMVANLFLEYGGDYNIEL